MCKHEPNQYNFSVQNYIMIKAEQTELLTSGMAHGSGMKQVPVTLNLTNVGITQLAWPLTTESEGLGMYLHPKY